MFARKDSTNLADIGDWSSSTTAIVIRVSSDDPIPDVIAPKNSPMIIGKPKMKNTPILSRVTSLRSFIAKRKMFLIRLASSYR